MDSAKARRDASETILTRACALVGAPEVVRERGPRAGNAPGRGASLGGPARAPEASRAGSGAGSSAGRACAAFLPTISGGAWCDPPHAVVYGPLGRPLATSLAGTCT